MLTDTEASALCDWTVRTEADGRATLCDGGETRAAATKEKCLAGVQSLMKASCGAQVSVGQAEDCSLQVAKEPCGSWPACAEFNAACAK